MASPDNSAPPRPTSVPAEARWDPKEPGFEWVSGTLDAEGRRHGLHRSWTRAGVLHGECNYDHGRVHGKNTNFHPDGTIASEATWVNGLIMDSVLFRSDAPTTEPFAQAAPGVWSVRYYTRDGKTNYTIRYFARDGSECGPDGKPLPARPKTVSADARWFPDIERWVDGEIERGTNKQVGRWRWWSQNGVLRHEETRDASGEATLVAKYHADGTLEKKTTHDETGEQRDYYFDDGVLSTRYRTDARGRQIYKGSWFDDGSIDEEQTRTFDGDHLASVTERGTGGVLAFEARREGTAMACVLYEPDGATIAATGLVEDGKLAGTWRLFERGVLHRELAVTPLAIAHEPTGQGLAWQLGEALFVTDEPSFETPAELAGIDAEPWSELAGAYDEHVEQFPRLARGLVSGDLKIRAYSLGKIAGEIEHQGSTYPATARVMPYLARLLGNPKADRSALLALIQEVGEAARASQGEARALPGVDGTLNAIAAGWPHVYAMFDGASADDRKRILALAKFAPHAKADVAELARKAPDPAMRACAIDSLVALPGFEAGDAMPSLLDKDPLVRAATAIALGLTLGPAAPREAVHMLDEAIRNWRDLAKRFAELPYTDSHVLAYIALAAGSIRTPDARSLTPQLCAPLDEVDGRSAISYGEGLLALAFGTGDRPYAKRFIEILDALAKSKQFWVFDVNAAEVVQKWHLPRTRLAIAALVTELRGSSDPEAVMHGKMHP